MGACVFVNYHVYDAETSTVDLPTHIMWVKYTPHVPEPLVRAQRLLIAHIASQGQHQIVLYSKIQRGMLMLSNSRGRAIVSPGKLCESNTLNEACGRHVIQLT